MTMVSGWRSGPSAFRVGPSPEYGGDLHRHVLDVDAAHSRDLPSEDYGNAQHPLASAGPRVAFVHPLDSGSAHDPLPIDCVWLWCGSSGGCARGTIEQSAQVAQ